MFDCFYGFPEVGGETNHLQREKEKGERFQSFWRAEFTIVRENWS